MNDKRSGGGARDRAPHSRTCTNAKKCCKRAGQKDELRRERIRYGYSHRTVKRARCTSCEPSPWFAVGDAKSPPRRGQTLLGPAATHSSKRRRAGHWGPHPAPRSDDPCVARLRRKRRSADEQFERCCVPTDSIASLGRAVPGSGDGARSPALRLLDDSRSADPASQSSTNRTRPKGSA